MSSTIWGTKIGAVHRLPPVGSGLEVIMG